MPYSEQQIRKLLADRSIRVQGDTVYSDLPAPRGYDPAAHSRHIAMLRDAYMLSPRDTYDVPLEPYVDGYGAGGSARRWLENEMVYDRNGIELDELRNEGHSPSRMYRVATERSVGPNLFHASPDQFRHFLGLGAVR